MLVALRFHGPITPRTSRRVLTCITCSLLLVSNLSVLAQRPVQQGANVKTNQISGGFEMLAAQANQARESNRTQEAIALYRKALGLRPKWDEGWWYLGTLLYDGDSYADAIEPFKQAAG